MRLNISDYKIHYRALYTLGLPIIIGQFGVIVLGFADTLMVGQHSAAELSAASFVTNIFTFATLVSLGFSYGLTPLVSRLFGRGCTEDIGCLLRNSLFSNTLFAVLITAILGIVYINLDRMGQPIELLPLINSYFLIMLISVPFTLWFNAFKQFAEGITDTRTSMWILLMSNVLNIVGNYLFIYGKLGCPELGLTGAGLATLAAKIVSFLAFVVIFFTASRYRKYVVSFLHSCINRKDTTDLFKLGLPVSFQMGVETAAFNLSAIMVGWLGAAELASHQIGLTIGNLCFLFYSGMGAAMSIRIAYFHGQKDALSAKRTTYAGLHIVLAFALLMSLPIFLFRNELGALFTDSEVISQMVANLVLLILLYQFSDGFQVAFCNALRGYADVKWTMIIAFISYILVSLPTGYYLGFICHMGIQGVWLGLPIGLSIAGIGYYIRFRVITK
ncbi:MAG: MATE family efflux transporter [Bacteroidaceae bacterium]